MSTKVKVSVAAWVIIGLVWFIWQRGSDAPLETISIADGAVTVRNQTGRDWQNVRIWINEHYAAGARVIPAGGFVRESLSRFVTSRGQAFQPAGTSVFSLVVLANEPDGTRVRIPWGKPVLH